MKTTIRLLSGIMIGALLAGCATETYVSQENREKFADVNVSKFLISECLAPQREIHIAVAEHFDFDKFKIREADATSLDAFIRDIQGLSGRITIVGHTDYKGSNEYNDALSLRRAQSVAAYLKQQLDPTFMIGRSSTLARLNRLRSILQIKRVPKTAERTSCLRRRKNMMRCHFANLQSQSVRFI